MKNPKQAKASKHENGVDFISNMPDPILQLILQALPNTEEVVRTSVLSTRWRYLWWTSIPYFPSLDIHCYRTAPAPSLKFPEKNFQDFVTWCLANKIVDLDSLRLCCAFYYTQSTVMGWIKEAVNHNVKSLDLMFYPKSQYTPASAVVLPKWLVTCDTLEVLRLNLYGHASLILAGRTELRFRALKVLELNNVKCSQTYEIEQYITMSPLLEELILIHCFLRIVGCVRISSAKLKTLIIRNWKNTIYHIEGCMLEVSCPELVSFELEFDCTYEKYALILESINSLKKAVILPDDEMHLSICHRMGDKICKVLAKLSRVESLSINLYFIQCIDAARDRIGNFPASFPFLKTLEVTTTIDAFTMNVIICILRCSPNLESLHLVIQKEHLTPEYWTFDEAETSRILTCHLKKVKFLGINGKKRKLVIARCLLEHGNALDEMVFSWRSKVKYHEKSMKMMNKISRFYKASSTVKLISVLED